MCIISHYAHFSKANYVVDHDIFVDPFGLHGPAASFVLRNPVARCRQRLVRYEDLPAFRKPFDAGCQIDVAADHVVFRAGLGPDVAKYSLARVDADAHGDGRIALQKTSRSGL